MKILLTRHTSVDVPQGTCYGWTDVNVKDSFEAEASIVKRRLDQHAPFDAVYSSPLTRARSLATFCGYPDHQTDPRLKEMNMGQWEMQRFDCIKDENLQRWYDDYIHVAPTGGESFEMFYQRVASFLNELKGKNHEKVAVFAHGGVLICAGIYAKLFSFDNCFEHQVGYGESEIIEI